jgi:GAF domain-containing protein
MLGGVPDNREPHLAGALAEMTSRLVGGPDAGTVLRLVTDAGTGLLGAAATGVMLVHPRGGIEVVSASDEPARFVELLQTQTEQGPCVECIAVARVITARDLEVERSRWPQFVPAALRVGYRAVCAVPMRLDGRAIGGLNLLYTEPTTLTEWQLRLAQVIADLAVLGLVQEPGTRRADRLAERTLTALNDRVRFDQAIGLIAGTLEVEPAVARGALTGYAQRTERTLREVAQAVTDGSLDPAVLTVGDSR